MADKKFTFYENILSESLIEELHNYYCGNTLNLSAKQHGQHIVDWFVASDARGVVPATVNLTSDHQMRILDELYSNEHLPLYKNKKMLRGLGFPMRINNFLPGGTLPPHTDTVWASLTLFLNKEWKEEWGGQFVWYKDEDTEQENGIAYTPKYNCGMIDVYDDMTVGAMHRVLEVTHDIERCTVQAFFGLKTGGGQIGQIPEKYQHLLPNNVTLPYK